MGVPFSIVEGVVFAADDTGKIIKLGASRDLFTALRSEISTGNSSAVSLGAGSSFVGAWTDVLEFPNLSISVKSSHASASNGLIVEWSSDGVNVDDSDSFSIQANVGRQFSFGKMAQFVRVRYTNGGTIQTFFRLQTLLHRGHFKPSSHRVGASIQEDDDTELVKSVLTGKAPSGAYKNVLVDESGNLFATIAAGSTIVPTIGSDLVYEDMNSSTGGIARGTTITPASGWNQIYSYTGHGLLLGVMTTLEDLTGTDTNFWQVRIVIDTVEIFSANGISCRDMAKSTAYNWNTGTTPSPTWGGLNLVQDTFRWDSPNNLPVSFSTGVKVYIRRQGTVNRVFRTGLVCISRGT